MVEVVDVEVVDVVDEVVDVDGAVVTGIVVDVGAVASDVVVSRATVDEVEPASVVAALSLLQPAAVMAMRMSGRRHVDFTREVWHALPRLPDQRV
ncbi:MAG: hypothetical protein ABIZ69_05310, partial [Ilumatobacteraceae bacterium]